MVIRGLSCECVGAEGDVVPGESVGLAKHGRKQGRTIEEFNFDDGAITIGRGRIKRDVHRRGEDRAVAVGAIRFAEGGAFTVMVTGMEEVLAPTLSVARAVKL